MGFDSFDLFLSLVVFFTYGSICVIAVLFTFFLDTYLKIDEMLNLDILTARILSPLDIDIYGFDKWIIGHNRIFGSILIILSLIDLKLFFNLINTL